MHHTLQLEHHAIKTRTLSANSMSETWILQSAASSAIEISSLGYCSSTLTICSCQYVM